MNEDPFASVPPRAAVALIDLVETQTPEESRAFVTRTTSLAREVGGRVAIANQAITPMIVPDETAENSDRGIRLLVVTHYPTKQAAELSFGQRQGSSSEASNDRVRTYAAQPAGRIESLFGRTLPYTLGLRGRKPVPKVDGAQAMEAIIDAALILGEQPDKVRWMELAERAGDRPIWMLNFLEFEKTAVYSEKTAGDSEKPAVDSEKPAGYSEKPAGYADDADNARSAAPAVPISGARAYRNYGQGMISSLAAVGGRVGWSGRMLGQLAGSDDGPWHQVAIAVYPSPAAMMTMLASPKYRAAHVHRAAALARTRLLATQPA